MADSNLSYSRKKPELDMLNPVPEAISSDRNVDETAVHTPVLSDYSRRSATLSSDLICIISGGTDRERKLFNEIEKKQTFNNINIVFVSSKTANLPAGGMTPTMMAAHYNKIKNDGVVNLKDRQLPFNSIDRFYLITDVDHYYNELVGILGNLSARERKEWIISNPAIEIWLYYCFYNNPATDLRDITDVAESQHSSWLKKKNGELHGAGGIDPRKTFENLETGIRNSITHYAEDKNGIPSLLSTQMHRLAQDILDTLGPEYYNYLKNKQRTAP